jgi:Amt family ammonium transporter
LVLQIINIVALITWVAVTALVLFWVTRVTTGLRTSREEELEGLDVREHGIEAYPEGEPAISIR